MMKPVYAVLGPVLLCAGLASQTGRGAPEPQPGIPLNILSRHVAGTPSVDFNLLVLQYCVMCHNDVALTGNLTLQSFDIDAVVGIREATETAEKMIRKLRAGMMPPPGSPRPGPDTLTALATELETRIDEAAAANPNPGSRTFQRLNRAEYASSVKDLLGLEIDVNAFLPLDTKSANFDNIADVQMPSATLIEGYLRAAGYISRVAVGDPDADAGSTTYRVPRTASQKDRVEGAPFGTRGGLSVIHNFPADGKYVFQVTPMPSPEGQLFGRNSLNERVEISIDGEMVAVVDLDRWMSESEYAGMRLTTDSIYVRAGAKRVTAAFIRRFEGVEDDLITPIDNTLADTQIGVGGYGVTTLPHLQRFAIVGPFHVSGVSDTPSRRRIFTCRPTSPEEARPCAESIISRLASRAYRVLAGRLRNRRRGHAFAGGVRRRPEHPDHQARGAPPF